MPTFCTARRRSSKRSNRHHSKPSCCWRNPLVVFVLCFAILGSLRFRVPARSQIIAANQLLLLKRRREHQRRKRDDTQQQPTMERSSSETGGTVPRNNSTNRTTTTTRSIRYTLIESSSGETTTTTEEDSTSHPPHRAAFFKYRVVDANDVDGGALPPLTMEQWASAIATTSSNDKEDDSAIALLNQLIAESPFRAVFFETSPFVPSTSSSSSSIPFEFVLVDAPKLHELASNHPNEAAFRGPLSSSSSSSSTGREHESSEYGAVFPNLSGDSVLVVPKPLRSKTNNNNDKDNNNKCYAHLASFVRTGPPAQVAALWKLVAHVVLDRIQTTTTTTTSTLSSLSEPTPSPFWLSTSGTGVYWLHFRFDRAPKYYSYEPYKQLPQSSPSS